ncbi:MAG: M20 family metallopeptidase [Candidatus Omnitrophica bacterium]|nr:M20 family metallopeptidase [Candidatus Omnitrophota bacterium]MDD5652599.1 M20 family metallopeptidase [Candidatus Omnitrophota bacterium]
MINKNRLIKLAQDLIRINSENPAGNEVKIVRFVKKYLADCGVRSRIYSFAKNRPNIIARIKGKQSKRSLLITPHLDTVPAGNNWKFPPFAARIHRGKIYGLGATDCKCNLAVSLEVIRSLAEEKKVLGYDLIFAATADEESGPGLGLIPLLKKGVLKPDVALILDADEFDIIVTQKGLMHLKIKISGKRSHGAYPWRGINAIDIAANILKELKTKKSVFKKNKYLRPPTVNTGTIKGGDKVNVVADWCEIELDFRFLPGMRAGKLLAELKQIIKKYAKRFKIEIEGIQQPYEIPEGHALVRQLKKAVTDCRVRPKIKGSEGATVITFFKEKNIPAVATGFGSAGCAHSANEYVEIANLYKGAQILQGFLENYQF